MLGLVLLLLAVGYAFYYWYESDAQSRAFRSGLAAEEQKDWDRAVADFARAGDRRGADEKETWSRLQVAERDRLYSEGLLAGERNEWGTAISAFEKVLVIQPSYRDSATRLAEAHDKLYKHSLAGLVYLVSARTPADGLYLRDESGRSTRLPGSDAQSLLRASSPDGSTFVYDTPRSEADYCTHPISRRQGFLLPCQTERVPVVARWAPGGELTTLALRELDGTARGTFTGEGIWWYKALPTTKSSDPVRYYDLKSRRVSEVVGHEVGTQVWALDPLRSRVVLAEEKLDAATGMTETVMYVAGSRGEEPRLLRTWPRTSITQVAISPDGRWLVLLSQEAAIGFPDSAWVVPLDRDTEGLSRLITLSEAQVDSGVRLGIAFVPSDEHLSRVIVSLNGPGGELLFAFVPEAGVLAPITSLHPDGAPYRRDLSAISHEGTYLATRVQLAGSATLELTGTQPDSEATRTGVQIKAQAEQSVRVQFSPRDDYVLASVQYPDGMRLGRIQKVYAAVLGEGGSLGKPHLVCMALLPGRREMPALAMPADGSLLAYITPSRQLRTAFYDGAPGRLIARNVRAVWSLRALPDAVWWR